MEERLDLLQAELAIKITPPEEISQEEILGSSRENSESNKSAYD